ncbi:MULTISPECIES: UbiD family decarboxylase [unclassified Methanosarcina]|uniref:UbiD family decarboxylase n=1 Tax=unclassified Methanosarcina TaxID=2644672 RepID=UPI000615D5E6|nr:MULTISPECIES: UbiD family decarboxylase [unclassified Methanosarcina]AKB17035.1 3-octaprenyl-4-hydroxybenzoate decarboxylase [Methanosarcina sp. WWM596]AKB20444.1 3-octaprenyl-4-hydroxybenzoate decarboxylase [Methanosarcina sp. WH1]
MSYRDFIDRLKENGKLVEVPQPVSPRFEASRIAKKTKAPVLFRDISGSKVIMNLLGSRDELASMLGVLKEEIIRKLAEVSPEGEVRIVSESPTLEVIENEVDLTKLPILTHFEKDGAPYITAGIVVSEYGGTINASIHRLMLVGKDKLAARLVPPRHTYLLHKKAIEKGEPLPVAIVIGCDPTIIYATSTRVPVGKEFEYAAALRGAPVELFECSNGIKVPHSEIVLEGYVDPVKKVDEGPFVDITGTYDVVRKEPVIHITRVIHRKDPIYHGILPAGPEHLLMMGVPYEPRIYRAVGEVTTVKNVVLTEGGCCYLHAIVQIEKQTEGDGKNAIMAAFAAHTSLKHVVVVDEDINIFDPDDVEFAIATRVKGDMDIMIIPNVRGSSLDPRGAPDGTTTKVGIDATKVLIEKENFERAVIPEE